MNKKNELELFYILPYTKSYDCGGYYRSDETGSTAYRPPSESIWNGNPLIFDEKEQLLNWFFQNAGNPIPNVYRIKYIANCFGVDDVIKITNLENDETEYYTVLDEDFYAKYDEDLSKFYNKHIWEDFDSFRYSDKELFRFEYIYKELIKRGIEIKFNVYKEKINKKERFEFIGDPFFEEEQAKGKNLVLYRPSLNRPSLMSSW